MAEQLDEQVERRITRYLDGEMDDQESAAILREVIRNPTARELMEQSRAIDESSDEALDAILGKSSLPVMKLELSSYRARHWYTGFRVAAAVALLALGGLTALIFKMSTGTLRITPLDQRIEQFVSGDEVSDPDSEESDTMIAATILELEGSVSVMDANRSGQHEIAHDVVAWFDEESDRFSVLEIETEITDFLPDAVDL